MIDKALDRPATPTDASTSPWAPWAGEAQLSPTPEMVDKYSEICVLCKEERRCGECCVMCRLACRDEIACEYVKDIINSMGLALSMEEWQEVYKHTINDAIIMARCKCLSDSKPVAVHQLTKQWRI